MANARSSGTWFVDAANATSYLSERQIKVVGIIFYVDATTDTISIYDKLTGSDAAGVQKLSLMSSVAKNIIQIRLADEPITFPNGLAVTTVGSPKITFILSQAGTN
jgi:hypothetical protein